MNLPLAIALFLAAAYFCEHENRIRKLEGKRVSAWYVFGFLLSAVSAGGLLIVAALKFIDVI